jgi:hypothetical protein
MRKTAEKKTDPTPQPVVSAAPPPPSAPLRNDGFNDRDDDNSGSLIKGSKLKFTNDYKWLTRQGDQLGPEREFLPVEILRVHQIWGLDGKPENRVLGPDESWPDIEKLNDETPRSEWRESFGVMKGPHENAYFVYLLDPTTLAVFTFITTTDGGKRAVSELKEATRRARALRGPNMFPIVTLGDTLFSKKFGRNRPEFRVKTYVPLGREAAAPAQLEHSGAAAKKPNDLNDSISFN